MIARQAEDQKDYDDMLQLIRLGIDLSMRVTNQVPKISETINLMSIEFNDSLDENDSVILEIINFRHPRIIEQIEGIRGLVRGIYSKKDTVEDKIQDIQDPKIKEDLTVHKRAFERITMPQVSQIEETLAYFEFLIQTLEFSKSRAWAEMMIDSIKAKAEASIKTDMLLFVTIFSFYDKEEHVGILVLLIAEAINVVLNVIIFFCPTIVFEGPSSWRHFWERKKHLRHFNSFLSFY